VCHALLQDPAFFLFLLRIDEEFASQARGAGCACGGVLHSARYPRKPRGCPAQVREHYGWRFSFCCARCDRRATPASVRFLGRRVYLAVVLTLVSSTGRAAEQHLAKQLNVSVRTLNRWREWWRHDFLCTPFWQSMRARFTAPAPSEGLPQSLLDRFDADSAAQRRVLLLRFLAPLSTRVVSG
jgi:hypothetical protein